MAADGQHPDPRALLDESRQAWSPAGDLGAAPAKLVPTRLAWHAVAEQVLKPAREAATGNEIALRWYPGGFGTPPFADDHGHRVIRVDGLDLVDECDGSTRRAPLRSLRETGTLVGDLVDTGSLADEPLALDGDAAAFLAGWFAFATMVIADLRVGAAGELDPGWVQLWPEHFDVATELGVESAGARAGYGASPGDEQHPEPYVYVAPWSGKAIGGGVSERWPANGFAGAELGIAAIAAAPDAAGEVREFFHACLRALTA